MFEWLIDARVASAQARIQDLETQLVRATVALEAKTLEADLLGEMLETYRRQVKLVLATLAIQGKNIGADND